MKSSFLVAVVVGVAVTVGPSSPVWAGSSKRVRVVKDVKLSNNKVGSNNNVNVGSPPGCMISDPDLSGTEISVSRGPNSTTITVNPPDNGPGVPSCT